MKKHVALAGLVGAVLLVLIFGLDSERAGDDSSDSSRLIDAVNDQQLPSELAHFGDRKKSKNQSQVDTISDDELVDGTVAREWGTFIGAKDIRSNCRERVAVIRAGEPQEEDYYRTCDIETVFDHPYVLFSDEQLEQIAAYDAEAAYLLSYRMLLQMEPGEKQNRQTLEEGLSHAMNALVQTGEKQVFDLLIDGRKFQHWSVATTPDGRLRDSVIAEKKEQYKWLKAGRNLGLIDENDGRWILVSRQVGRLEEHFDIEELDARAAHLSDGVSRQLTIVGTNRMD